MILLSAKESLAAAGDFSDVPVTHKNHTAIMELKSLGVIQGYPDGTFKPEQNVNRAEALKIILLGSDITVDAANNQKSFNDVEPGSWYVPYIIKAVQLGIIQGYPDGSFKPAQTLNLVENLKMLLLTNNIDLTKITVTQNPYKDAFANQWYAKYLQYAKDKNLIDADRGNFIYPAGEMTRGKLAEVMYRLIYIQKDQNQVPEPGAGQINYVVDPSQNRVAVSPYIYGTNEIAKVDSKVREPNLKLIRYGGNRWTAYNWENNASNAGTDYGPNSSDSYLSDSNVQGDAVKSRVDDAFALSAAAMVTIPIVDYVSADKNGIVSSVATDANVRWVRNFPNSGSGKIAAVPDSTDRFVYQDQFVNWLQNAYKDQLNSDRKIFYSLDNEPGLWSGTHPLVHPNPATYAEMAKRTVDFSSMIKRVAPDSLVFGAVAYGYYEFVALQGAPDQNGRDYLDFFLDTVKTASDKEGKRLVDVLDLHWYPEAKGGDVRITDSNNANPGEDEITARVQAPRSLWDPSYVENSWISKDVLNSGAIKLIPWLNDKIIQHYPGTKLSFSEYNYGGNENISGGLAQADVLGVFGREGVFAAAYWPMGDDSSNCFAYGAFDLYLNYDGKGGMVGDTSVLARNPDVTGSSIYAFADSKNPVFLDVMVINKSSTAQNAIISINNGSGYSSAQVYKLTAENRKPVFGGVLTANNDNWSYSMPALSASLLVFSK
jgi:hypothetical protein